MIPWKPWIAGALFGALSACASNDHGIDSSPLVGPKSFLTGYPAIDPEGNVHVVVEIPTGTTQKWEVDKNDGALHWEIRDGTRRVVQYLGYPGNYGMIPRTLLPEQQGGDGDPLDVLLLGDALPRGTIAKARVIGMLKMQDDGEQDDKLIAVNTESPLAASASIDDLEDRFPGVCDIVETWFRNYKGHGKIKTNGFVGPEQAQTVLHRATRAFEAESDRP